MVMELYRIKIMNRIVPEGLALFGPGFEVGPDVDNPQGIVVRSSKVDTGDYPGLLAVARAGAGVNNISKTIRTVAEAASKSSDGADQTLEAATKLVQLSEKLKGMVDKARAN